MTTIYTFMASD